jgi:hypothetical protein
MGVSPWGRFCLDVTAAIAVVFLGVFLAIDGAASKVSRNKINPLSQAVPSSPLLCPWLLELHHRRPRSVQVQGRFGGCASRSGLLLDGSALR